jgi:hypothetical protein
MIYFAQLPTGAIKIGFTDGLEARLSGLANHYGTELALLATMPGDRSVEAEIHERFSHLRLGRTEQFRPAADLMAFIGKPLLVDPNPDAVETHGSARAVVTKVVKMTESYAEWLERFATHERVNLSSLIDRALSDHAEQTGFDPPPDRTA